MAATKKQTQSERMKAIWERRRANAPNGKVTIKRRKKGGRRTVRLTVDRSPLELAWRASEKIEALLDELPSDLRTIVLTHLARS
jgi:hypothetical protein